jgi:hypothetical protein
VIGAPLVSFRHLGRDDRDDLRLSPEATPTVVDSNSRLISQKTSDFDSIIQGQGHPEAIVRLIVDVVSVVLSLIFRLVTELSLVKWGIVGLGRARCFRFAPKSGKRTP